MAQPETGDLAPETTDRWRSEREVSLAALSALAVGVGIAVALAATAFRALLALIFHLGFHGEIAFQFSHGSFQGLSPLGPWVVGVPVIGGLCATALIRHVCPTAGGPGVPEVLKAIYYADGRMPGPVAPVKILATAASVGSGASAGREGPMIHIGAALGEQIADYASLRPWQRISLLTAGAGAGIASLFNAPLAGMLFAVELLMPEISGRTFLPVVIATATATAISRLIFGVEPAFPVGDIALLTPSWETVAALVLFGLVCGVAAWGFIHLVALTIRSFRRIPGNAYVRSATGMLLVGVIIYVTGQILGEYHVHSIGYDTILAFLRGEILLLVLVAALVALKLLTTLLSLGSGAVGGIFAPALFLGAGLGVLFADFWALIVPGAALSAAAFAILGMAGLVGAMSGAAATAVIMIFEMTQAYSLVVPLMVVTGIAFGLRRSRLRENAYSMQLAGSGLHVPEERYSSLFLVRQVRDSMDTDIIWLPAEMPLSEALAPFQEDGEDVPHHVIVTRGRQIAGTLALTWVVKEISAARKDATLGELADPSIVLARPEDRLDEVLNRLAHHPDTNRVIVVSGDARVPRARNVVGILDQNAIGEAVLADHHG